jgi:HEAT repeat protein
VARLAVIALTALGAVAEPDLARALDGTRATAVRQAAASGLVQVGVSETATLEKLRDCLDDDDAVLAEIASLALARSGQAALPYLVEAADASRLESRRWALLAISQIGTAADASSPALVSLLRAADPSLQLSAALALANTSSEPSEGLAILLEAARSPSAEIQELAAERMGRLRSPSEPAVEGLMPLLRSESPAVACQAALALGRLRARQPAVRVALEQALQHRDLEVRRSSLIALASWGPEAWESASVVERLLLEPQEELAPLVTATLDKLHSAG